MGRHSQSAGNFRHKYPVLAASAILAVAGVSSFLVVGGAPATPVLAGGESAATVSSSGRAIYGCVKPGRGLSSVSVTGAPDCPSGAYGVTWQVQLTQPTATDPATVTPTNTSTSTPADPAPGTPTDPPTVNPTDPSTSSPSGSGIYFGLAPAGTALPRSDAYCAAHVQPMAETVAANTTANHTVPSGPVQFGPWAQRIAYFKDGDVDGNFTGTTGEILEWAACKWGWDQDFAMAEAVRESTWRQSEVGDNGHSYGILQVRVAKAADPASANSGWGGYPWVQQSTALDADAQMAYLRACYDGAATWLGNGYQAGNAWGCIGSWFSGQWLSAAADGYISRVQAVLNSQGWLKL